MKSQVVTTIRLRNDINGGRLSLFVLQIKLQ